MLLYFKLVALFTSRTTDARRHRVPHRQVTFFLHRNGLKLWLVVGDTYRNSESSQLITSLYHCHVNTVRFLISFWAVLRNMPWQLWSKALRACPYVDQRLFFISRESFWNWGFEVCSRIAWRRGSCVHGGYILSALGRELGELQLLFFAKYIHNT